MAFGDGGRQSYPATDDKQGAYRRRTWRLQTTNKALTGYKHGPKADAAVELNSDGFPIRPGVPDCSFYVKSGRCKYKDWCKWNHPASSSTSRSHRPWRQVGVKEELPQEDDVEDDAAGDGADPPEGEEGAAASAGEEEEELQRGLEGLRQSLLDLDFEGKDSLEKNALFSVCRSR